MLLVFVFFVGYLFFFYLSFFVFFFFFFFSSRRRHTRSTRDWSSDVCSSDLGEQLRALVLSDLGVRVDLVDRRLVDHGADVRVVGPRVADAHPLGARDERSEERRVGKGGGSRWWSEY